MPKVQVEDFGASRALRHRGPHTPGIDESAGRFLILSVVIDEVLGDSALEIHTTVLLQAR